MIRFFYSALFYLLVPLLLLRLLYRSIKSPRYRRRWLERFGFIKTPPSFADSPSALNPPGQLEPPMPIWVHAVSVGETVAAVPLVKRLLERYPERSIVVTTMTPTGSERVRESLGDTVFHCYLPYDLPGAMNRFIRTINPALLIVMETELWPNMLNQCHRRGVRTLLANGRLSEKSARGYRKIGSLTRAMLQQVDCIAAQSEEDGIRFVDLGANSAVVHQTGSLKFDMDLPANEDTDQVSVFQQIQESNRPVFIAASTREGEDEKILTVFQQCLAQVPALTLVLVPRHPERFNTVANLCAARKLQLVRRSSNQGFTDDTQVLLGDSMGEMWRYFRLADIAFVGGSLVNTGCHNVLEPAALGIPVLVGPSQFNFAAICHQLQEAGALITVKDERDLTQRVLQLLTEPELRESMGAAGLAQIQTNRGSLDRILFLVEELLPI